ncbi:hypothetical protein KHA94_00390 [Bacillus sp. FJAT-49705]|uniref:Uncharacterized protein n=1 Tax=Cytobacillus citreus TaxID=2833586 RepID=A0ABS5NMM4_9BACI|nr:hypothetical protein [Cytobacillus citreus]MBS4188678.1 hypothetical protein [Cytobacillus citreus]
MKIKIIKDIRLGHGWLRVGDEFSVRNFPSSNLFTINNPYQIIEGSFSGVVVPREFCILHSEEKAYTEKEWNDLKEHHLAQLKKEREQTAIFQGLARKLTEELQKKNKENERLDFFVTVLSTALKASCEAIKTLKEKKAN